MEKNQTLVPQVPELSLIEKVCSETRTVNKQGVINILKGAWKTKYPFDVYPWDQNLYLFCFSDVGDRAKIIADSPWSIMGNILSLITWNPDMALAELDFSTVEFWVQAHGLPLGKMNRSFVDVLAAKLGRLIETDCIGDGIQLNRSFLRFRVAINIKHPLVPGFMFQRDGLAALWIEFKYERLSNFCYSCGRIGHDEDSCKYKDDTVNTGDYGPWLRATGIKRIWKPSASRVAQESPKINPANTFKESIQNFKAQEDTIQKAVLILSSDFGDKEKVLHQQSSTDLVDSGFHPKVSGDGLHVVNKVCPVTESKLKQVYYVTEPTEIFNPSSFLSKELSAASIWPDYHGDLSRAVSTLSIKRKESVTELEEEFISRKRSKKILQDQRIVLLLNTHFRRLLQMPLYI